jgi:hypothetical protein
MGTERVFSEEEVAEIMRRAVSLQEGTKDASSAYKPGVTHSELMRAAKEMGVDPSFLEQAINERLKGRIGKRKFLGEESRVVDGELDPSDFDIVLSQVRTRASRRHPVTQIGRTLQGQAFTGSGLATMEVTSRNGRTRINVKPFVVFEALGTFYPAFIVTMLANAKLAEMGNPAGALAVTTAVFGAAAIGFLGWVNRSRSAAANLADKLQATISDHLASEGSVREKLGGSQSVESEVSETTLEQR